MVYPPANTVRHPRVDQGNVWKKVQAPVDISIQSHREDESSLRHPGGCEMTTASTPLQPEVADPESSSSSLPG
eukprot:7617843-Heterocapsa_arctica.AAC.1